jgi:hypothetical protein
MTIYYKTVQMDGTDFWTGTVDYASLSGTGRSLPRLPGGQCCGPGVYHASTVAAETLIGGYWPCRLFEVEGEAVSESGHKRGFRTLTVGQELPAWRALGPNGEAVAALLEKAERLTDGEISGLGAAWNEARDAVSNEARSTTWNEARDAARGAARDAARCAAREAAREAAMGLARNTVGNAVNHAAKYLAARNAAVSSARSAAMAMVTQDLITEEQFRILADPWLSVMGGTPA